MMKLERSQRDDALWGSATSSPAARVRRNDEDRAESADQDVLSSDDIRSECDESKRGVEKPATKHAAFAP